MNFYRLTCILVPISLFATALQAQNPPKTPEEKEKQMLEFVDKEVTRLSELLNLEYWQEYYVDSILTHDYKAMTRELEALQQAKVENTDLYVNVQDKWRDQIDKAYQKLFTAAPVRRNHATSEKNSYLCKLIAIKP